MSFFELTLIVYYVHVKKVQSGRFSPKWLDQNGFSRVTLKKKVGGQFRVDLVPFVEIYVYFDIERSRSRFDPRSGSCELIW